MAWTPPPGKPVLSSFNPKAPAPKPLAPVYVGNHGLGSPPPTKPAYNGITTGPSVNQISPARQKEVAQATAAQHIKDMQQFLKNRGYNITVDGIRGPQTNSIVAAFHNHVTPQQLASKASGTVSSKAAQTPTAPTQKAPAGNGGASRTTPTPKPAAPATTAPDPNAIDPYAYASSSANAAYDPQIAAAQQALNQLSPQHQQNNADLTSWYTQLANLIGGQQTQQGKDSANQLSQYDTAANNAVGQLFGGTANPAASEAMAFHDIGHTALQGEDNAQANFLANMKPILNAQGIDALRGEQGAYDKNNATLGQQLASLKSAKGQAYTSALATGQNMATQAATAKQSLDLAKTLAPYQAQQASAQARTAQIQADNAAAQAKSNLALTNAQVKKAQAQATGAGGQWNLTNPTDRGSLSQALRASIGTPQGTLRVSPQIALQNIQQALVQAGLGDSPEARDIAQSVFTEVLNNSHSAKLWRHVTYVNGQLKVTRPKAKK
jgi:IgA-specific serine endopeptidase